MTKEVAFKAISFAVDFHARNLKNSPFVLGFFGGEPLLEVL
jgi:sulfatase maturation enzyme AslB (radical SAM superfamily)